MSMSKPLVSKATSAPARRLLFINFERNAQPINVTTLRPTLNFTDPNSTHPYAIRTKRKLSAFDASKLHWAVSTPLDLSKSAYIRNRAARRVREAFRRELHRAGWDSEGRRLAEGGEEGGEGTQRGWKGRLSGALKLGLVKDSFALTASEEEVRMNVAWALRTVISKQRDAGANDKAPNARGGARNYHGKGKTQQGANHFHRIMRKD